jgi:uncharacterized protein (DUF1800 family)
MPLNNRLKNQHLLWRAGFGPMAENAAGLETIHQKKLWELLLKTSEKKPEKIEVAQNLIDGLFKGVKDISAIQKTELTKEQKKQIRQQYKTDVKNLNIRWLEEMVNSEAQLREKMSLFWHGHFACRVINSFFQQELLHTIRQNALGNFGDLLKAVSKSPAMLQFLNNQQNRKKHPNENFAREVMELFTLGTGNYTEIDIKEAARAFTGWGFNIKGEFEFRKLQHDNEDKIIFGKTGRYDGNDVIEMLLENKQTALFITKKIYRYFVNEKIDTTKAEWLSNRFYQSGYDIKKLLADIYTSDWFYEEKNIGNKIKSPVELLAGIQRFLPMELQNNSVQILFQKLSGQILFYPPNVAGWPGGKNWIDSSTLMLRLQIPQILTANQIIDVTPKSDDDVMMGQMMEEKTKDLKNISVNVDWEMVNKIFEQTSRENLLEKITQVVLQTGNTLNSQVLNKYTNTSSRENYIKSAIINLMSTPEYQLC